MMVRAKEVMHRSARILLLRKGIYWVDGNVDNTWLVAKICDRFAKKLYARGHTILEWEYGG